MSRTGFTLVFYRFTPEYGRFSSNTLRVSVFGWSVSDTYKTFSYPALVSCTAPRSNEISPPHPLGFFDAAGIELFAGFPHMV